MYINMCVYMYIYTRTYRCMYTYVLIYQWPGQVDLLKNGLESVFTYKNIDVYTCVCICIYTHTYKCVYTYVLM